MSELEIQTTEVDGVATVSLIGELDISTVGDMERAMRTAEEGGGPIRLDLSGLRFIDSTGLRAVVSASARSASGGATLSVVRGPERVHRVFRLARLEDRLSFED